MYNNHIILNKKDGKTIHYMNCRVHILQDICKIHQYDYDEILKENVHISIIKYNINDIKSIEIGE